MVRALKTGKNPELARGIRSRGPGVRKFKSSRYLKKNPGVIKASKDAVAAKKAAKNAVVTKPFQKGTRVVGAKKGVQRFYPTERVRRKLPRQFLHRREGLRKSITPGTVLVLLSGKFRGKRVVFLKQLASGLLLVNGPFALNGVPLRRVSQAYVIATSTKVDLGAYKVDEKLNDAFFARPKQARPAKSEAAFLKKVRPARTPLSDERKALQKASDAVLLAAIKKVDLLAAYLKSRFTLTNGQYPHMLKF